MEVSLKDLKELLGNNDQCAFNPYKIGEKYLVRTVTMIYTGKLEAVGKQELVFSQVCWIPETERWNETLSQGTFREVEPYPVNETVIIGRGAILDVCRFNHELPSKAK